MVFQFYSVAQYNGLQYQEREARQIREFILHLLGIWLCYPEPRAHFSKNLNCTEIRNFFSQFLPSVESTVAAVIEIFQRGGDNRGGIRDAIEILKSCTELVQSIADFAPNALILPGQETIIPRVVIFVFDRYCRVDELKDITSRWKEYGYTPIGFLLPFIIVAIRIGKIPEALAKFKDKSLGYREGLYEEISRTLVRFTFDDEGPIKAAFVRFIDNVNKEVVPVTPERVSQTFQQPPTAPESVNKGFQPAAAKVNIPIQEIPAEYLDFVTSELMYDPVILPGDGEGVSVDRSTLPQLKGENPVTGGRFRNEDVEGNEVLKRKIQTWVMEWKQSH
jgi:hypothetical protein